MTWKRNDIELGQLFDHDGLIYRVVGLIDEPVVVVRPRDERDGEDDEHYVISAPLFAEFKRVELRHAGGAVEVPRDEWAT